MSERYRVVSERGYYYSTRQGQDIYTGRMDGQKLWADVMCQQHAQEIVDWLNGLTQLPGDGEYYVARLEKFPGHAPCAACERDTQEYQGQ